MAINIDKANEFDENGIAITDFRTGQVLFYLTTGNSDPSGSDAPENTWFFRLDTKKLYYKYGPLNTDWRQLRAADLVALNQQAQSTTIQALLDEIAGGGGTGVAQTLVYGDGGNTSQNSWLPNQGVPSNVVGVPVGLANAKLRSVFLGNKKTKTGNIIIRERSPAITGSWVDLYTLSLSSQKTANITGLDIAVTQNAEVGVFTQVSLKNVKVVVNVNGDSA